MAAFVARTWLATSLLTGESDEPVAAGGLSAFHPLAVISGNETFSLTISNDRPWVEICRR